MIPAAAYLCVSSEMQVEVGSSLPSQLAVIREWALRNDYEILPEHIYSTVGVILAMDTKGMREQMIDSWVEKVTVYEDSITVVFAINPADVGISITLKNASACLGLFV